MSKGTNGSKGPKRIVQLSVDEVVVSRSDLAVAIRRLDAARLFLYQELVRAETLPVERGNRPMGAWVQANHDELAYGGWSIRDRDLLEAFHCVWGVGEVLAESAIEPFLSLEKLQKEGSHFLPSHLFYSTPEGDQ